MHSPLTTQLQGNVIKQKTELILTEIEASFLVISWSWTDCRPDRCWCQYQYNSIIGNLYWSEYSVLATLSFVYKKVYKTVCSRNFEGGVVLVSMSKYEAKNLTGDCYFSSATFCSWKEDQRQPTSFLAARQFGWGTRERYYPIIMYSPKPPRTHHISHHTKQYILFCRKFNVRDVGEEIIKHKLYE